MVNKLNNSKLNDDHLGNFFVDTDKVLLINKSSNSQKILSKDDAIHLASGLEKNLIKVGNTILDGLGRISVCIIEDLRKYIYQQKKKRKCGVCTKSSGTVKEIQIRSGIDKHDLDIKISKAVLFLSKNNTVKIRIFKSKMGNTIEKTIEEVSEKIQLSQFCGTLDLKKNSPRLHYLFVRPKKH